MSAPIKLAEYVADFIACLNVRHVFAVSGGASLHLIHAVADHPKLSYVTPHHEQAAAMAADGYARTTGGLGVAMATSGPGATNLITGIACSYYDSLPVLFITGQVSTFRMVGNTGVRQIGFQETPIVEMCKSITKYAMQISKPERIRYELEKAVHLAREGRPGPVLIDIPDDFQRAMIRPEDLEGFTPPPAPSYAIAPEQMQALRDALAHAERPVLVLGWGVRLSGAERAALAFAETMNIPMALTWGAADMVPASHPLYIGTFGTHGMRHANFAVQNADCILSLGARLDTKATGTPVNTFARDAVKIVVDIDAAELGKFAAFGLTIDQRIHSDVNAFLAALPPDIIHAAAKPHAAWLAQIAQWKNMFMPLDGAAPACGLNPYHFMDTLAGCLPQRAHLFIDTGCSIAWAMQRLQLQEGQRSFHDFNNTAMGWALPAAIGGYFADPATPAIALVGDGSLMMTLHELATVQHHAIPLKLFVLNNGGYAMIRQTQDQWLGSRYYASSVEGGLSFPDYAALARAFGMDYAEIQGNECTQMVQSVLGASRPCLCNVIVPQEARVVPQVKFGRPNEDMEPLLPRELFLQQMITAPLAVSQEPL